MSRPTSFLQLAIVSACLALLASQFEMRGQEEEREIRLPSGKIQKEEILRQEHEQNLKDAARLLDLAQSLKAGLEKSDHRVLSVNAIKTAEEIERLAKRIRGRMRR